ncbi:hypothetical protein [Actinoplanes sp. N902-109]|uniref:hypothetical protein n=1 Tax=Actinoplanes sp. (strain N902-109) TaxID=649831 RepID=UPI0003293C11|nr:hypothetical protein [Actinoplanes sp. N902-109]AGL19316.1 Endo-beta-1,6-galactanase [Actinoplanes sp. N902-109]
MAIDPAADDGVRHGWGTLLAWWATVFGDRDDFADLFFTTRTVNDNGVGLPGLGLTIARYNLGAGSWDADAKQRAALVKATQRGATSELFANSPMWPSCAVSSTGWGCRRARLSGLAGPP